MKLTSEQIKSFDEQGYMFFPSCFSEEEVALLREEGDAILRTNRKEVWREKTGAPRTAFAAHEYNEAFRLMAHHLRKRDAIGAIREGGDLARILGSEKVLGDDAEQFHR